MSHHHYTHLSLEERIIIQNRHENGEDYKDIAKAINRTKETVWRELKRNGIKPDTKTTRVNKPRADARLVRGSIAADSIKARKLRYEKRRKHFLVHSEIRYTASTADKHTRTRVKQQTLLLERSDSEELLQFIITALDSGWSPEQISGRIRLEGIYCNISAKTIYKFIKSHPELDLQFYLPRKGKRYCKRQDKATCYNQSSKKRSIDTRPAVVDKLERVGDFEGDTIVGKDKTDRLLTHTERKSGMTSISRIIGFNAYKVKEQAIRDLVRVFGIAVVQTITYDNGVEFVFWKLLEQALQELDAHLQEQSIVYFAHPYHSWERGRNENINGLIRRFLPKGTDFKSITDDDILMIEFMLNNRPRKRLGWLTPSEYYSANVALER